MEAQNPKLREKYQKINNELKEVSNRLTNVIKDIIITQVIENESYDDAEYDDDDDDVINEIGPIATTETKKKHVILDNYDCPVCGSKIRLRSKARHEKTMKHKQADEVWMTRFVMK